MSILKIKSTTILTIYSNQKKKETKSSLTDEKKIKDMVVYFTRYVNWEWMIIDDYILKKILNKSKEIISVEKLIVTTILIDTDDKLPDDITFKKLYINDVCY